MTNVCASPTSLVASPGVIVTYPLALVLLNVTVTSSSSATVRVTPSLGSPLLSPVMLVSVQPETAFSVMVYVPGETMAVSLSPSPFRVNEPRSPEKENEVESPPGSVCFSTVIFAASSQVSSM